MKKQQESNRLKRLQRKRHRSRPKKNRQDKRKTKFMFGTWHFWFLHIITMLGALLGYVVGGLWGCAIMGLLMYMSPYLAIAPYMRLVSKKDMSKFYKLRPGS